MCGSLCAMCPLRNNFVYSQTCQSASPAKTCIRDDESSTATRTQSLVCAPQHRRKEFIFVASQKFSRFRLDWCLDRWMDRLHGINLYSFWTNSKEYDFCLVIASMFLTKWLALSRQVFVGSAPTTRGNVRVQEISSCCCSSSFQTTRSFTQIRESVAVGRHCFLHIL